MRTLPMHPTSSRFLNAATALAQPAFPSPVDWRDQWIGGHSFGGLFTLYAMFTDPSLFWGYLAGSPDIEFADHFIVKQENEFAKTHKDLPVRIFFAAGGDESPLAPRIAFVRTFAGRNYNGLHWDARVIEGEGHSSVKPEFYSLGLRFLFGNG